MAVIEDGKGKGFSAKVDDSFKLETRATINAEEIEASRNGDLFILTAGEVTLTTDNPSAILYYKNNEEFDLSITKILFAGRESTNGIEDWFRIRVMRNPTGITPEDGPLFASNSNYGDDSTLDVSLSRSGGEGVTLVGGTPVGSIPGKIGVAHVFSEVNATLPKGSSIGIYVYPPTGNTNQIVEVAINVFKIRG